MTPAKRFQIAMLDPAVDQAPMATCLADSQGSPFPLLYRYNQVSEGL